VYVRTYARAWKRSKFCAVLRSLVVLLQNFGIYAHFGENLGQSSECKLLKFKKICHNDRKSRRWRLKKLGGAARRA